MRPGLDGRAVQHIAIYAVKVKLQARLVEYRGNKAMFPGAEQWPDGLVKLAAGVLLELREVGQRHGQGAKNGMTACCGKDVNGQSSGNTPLGAPRSHRHLTR